MVDDGEVVAEYAKSMVNPAVPVEEALSRVARLPGAITDYENDALALLEIERVALAEAWKSMKQDLQDQNADDSTMGPVPHTFESVIMTVKEAQTEMNSRRRLGGGKPKQYYNKLASKAHQHRSAFDMFPSTNEYVSIFCGSIKTLIKASVNYIKISEGLSKALDEISDLVDFAKRQVEGIPTEYTRTALARLYKEIFLYLKDCTDWYNKKSRMRALKSFNEDFYDRFADRMKCIKDVAQAVHQETTIGGIRNLQTMLLESREQQRHLAESLEQQRRKQFDAGMEEWRMLRQQMLDENVQKRMLKQVLETMDRESGVRATGMLRGIYRTDSWEREEAEKLNRVCVPSARLINDNLEFSRVNHSEEGKSSGYQQSKIWESSKELENFIQGNSVDLLNTMPSSFAATPVAMKLREWLEVSEPTMLWIHGKPTNKYPSEFSILAGSLINAAMEAKAPIIFHFCEPINSHKPKEFTLEQAGAVSLVYGLIRQLIGVLAPEVDCKIDLGVERFSQLKNPLANWKAALSLLSDLLDLAPAVLLCVIDGLEYLDYGKGRVMCDEILSTFGVRRHVAEDNSLIFKILFTTAGSSRSLSDFMQPSEVVCSEVSRYQSYGKAGPHQKSFLS